MGRRDGGDRAHIASHGLPDATMKGAAEFYDFVAGSPLERERPEQRERGQTLEDVVEMLAAACAVSPAQQVGDEVR